MEKMCAARGGRIRHNRRGGSLVEYGLLIALASVAVVAAIGEMGAQVSETYWEIDSELAEATNREMCADLGGTIYEGNGHCFIVAPAEMARSDGAAWCAARGGHLPTFRTQAESDFIAGDVAGGQRTWIGLTDRAVDGTFVWDTGERLNFTNWNTGEPNNFGGNEDCVEVNHERPGGWNDQSCGDPRGIVCEIE